MFDARLNGEVRIFISGQELSGIDNASISYSNSSNIIKPLGSTKGLTVNGGPTDQKVSFSRYLIYNDPIISYTGDVNMSGSIHYNGESYGFESGYLNNYSVNCAVGSVPKVSAQFDIVDELRSGQSASGSVSHPTIDIPSQGSISITCDNASSNRVIGFDYSVTSLRKKHFTIGGKSSSAIEFIAPLEYAAQVQVDVDDAFLESGYNFLDNRENKTVSFTIEGRTGAAIQTLSIPNASLVNESLNVSANGSLKLNLNYIGHGF